MMYPIRCWLWKSPRARIVETHKHEVYEILVILKGTYEYEVKRQKSVARTGDVVFYPPGLIHREQNPPEDPPEMYILRFNWYHMPRKMPLQVYDRDGRLRVIAEWLNLDWQNNSGNWKKTRESYIHGIVAEALRLANPIENELVTVIRRYIHEHLKEPLTLMRLARHAHLSRSQFAYRYRQLCGVTPMTDVREIRLEEAKRLLWCTDLPRKVVAANVGLSGASILSKTLRKYKGVSPSQIRGNRKPCLPTD